jgi:hypothetical protein
VVNQPAVIAQERINTGEIAYNLKVTATSEGDYRGSWRCSHCRQSGESASTYAGQAAAIEWARSAATMHHAIAHT